LDFLGGIDLVAKIGAQTRHDVGHLKSRGFPGLAGHQPREELSRFGDLHRLAFLNPRGNARETFRKSLTVAVFIVRPICITLSAMSIVFDNVRRGSIPIARSNFRLAFGSSITINN